MQGWCQLLHDQAGMQHALVDGLSVPAPFSWAPHRLTVGHMTCMQSMVGTLTGGDLDDDDASIDEDSDDGQAFLSDEEEVQQGGYAQQGAYGQQGGYYGGQVSGRAAAGCQAASLCHDVWYVANMCSEGA
jgi:hypothetical protein